MEVDDIQKKAYNHGLPLQKEDLIMSQKQIELIGTGKKVLDVGCNDGTLSEIIQDRENDVVGLELTDSVKMARTKGIKAVKASAYKISFNDDTFDVVHCSGVIEHLLDTDKALSEMRKVLKKGGRLIITTPNFTSFRDRILVLSGRLQAHAYHNEHVRIFNIKRLVKSLEKNKLKIKKVYGSGFAIPLPKKCVYIFSLDNIIPNSLLQIIIVEAEK